jgi:tRNA1(Val) A37 N6-methylase TrmN6
MEAAVTHGTLLGGRVQFAQPAEGYRAAIDPVLLAAAVAAGPGERVLELGCGAGAALLCLAQRCTDISLTAIERDPLLAQLARSNAQTNGWEARIAIQTAPLESAALAPATFDHAMMNPPHLDPARHRGGEHPQKRTADLEDEIALALWVETARHALRLGGALTLIHRADRLHDVFAALSGFGAILIFPLWPKAGRAAKRVIVRAVKGSKQPMTLAAGLTLHRDDGGYTASADAILRDAAALDLLGSTER